MTPKAAAGKGPSLHSLRIANDKAKCPKACRPEYTVFVKAAWKAGWWCERRSDNYVKCWHPDGIQFVNVPCTPSKQGTWNITRRKFRRAGLDV
jgi:hypothetical protein